MAHLKDPTLLIDYTSGIDGGNFPQFIEISTAGLSGFIPSAYNAGNFAGTDPDIGEGAYVWAGAAVHLIEDQASPPHAADIIHGLADQFEGPMYYLGQKTANINNFNSQIPPAITAAGAPLTVAGYYNACLQQTQSNLSGGLGFTTVVKGVTYQTWLLNNNSTLVGSYGKSTELYAGVPPTIQESTAPYPDSPSNGEYGGLLEQPSLSTTAPTYQDFWTQPAPADIYNQNPTGYISNAATSVAGGSLVASLENGTIFASQSTQAAEYAYNFLIQLSLSLPPILSTFTINNAAAGTTPYVYASEPNNLALTIAENRISTVTVSLFIDDAPASTQTIVSTGALVTLPAALSATGGDVSNVLNGPFAWNSQTVPLAATANTQTLLPWMGVVSIPWDGTINGVALPVGPHTICAAVQDADGNWATFTRSTGATLLAFCQSFNVVTPPQLTMVVGPGYGPQVNPVPQQVLYDNFSGISADSPVSLTISNAVQVQLDNPGSGNSFGELSPLNISVQTSGPSISLSSVTFALADGSVAFLPLSGNSQFSGQQLSDGSWLYYAYSVSAAGTNATYTLFEGGFAPGNYTLTAVDSDGATTVAPFTAGSPITIALDPSSQVTCTYTLQQPLAGTYSSTAEAQDGRGRRRRKERRGGGQDPGGGSCGSPVRARVQIGLRSMEAPPSRKVS